MQAKMEAVSHVSGEALRIDVDFVDALTGVQLSLAEVCPALRKTSTILGD